MLKKMYFTSQYKEYMTAEIFDLCFDLIRFTYSERVMLNEPLRFKVNSSERIFKDQDFIKTNALSFIASERLLKYMGEVCPTAFQALDCNIQFLDTLSSSYKFINTLAAADIIDEDKSKKIYIDKSMNLFYLDENEIKYNNDLQQDFFFGRNNTRGFDSEIFFSARFSGELTSRGFSNKVVFETP